MAKFKHIDTGPRFLPVVLEQQLIPGTFEHALHHLLDNEIDLAHIEARYRNDDNGAPAYPPALLLKVILLGYARGMVSSRALARTSLPLPALSAIWATRLHRCSPRCCGSATARA